MDGVPRLWRSTPEALTFFVSRNWRMLTEGRVKVWRTMDHVVSLAPRPHPATRAS